MSKQEGLRRTIQMKFRVTEEEKAEIKNRMESVNIKHFEKYARFMMAKGEVKLIDFPALKALRLEVNRIGTNINQVAKRVNENGSVSLEDIAELKAYQRELDQKINQLINDELRKVEKY
ncbi:TPA: MobC family plasmid mobilization relaxosome protein [Streptococcus suis]|nr:MobC family plasmid mobilization relaxosome protein [Streptococcus suis]